MSLSLMLATDRCHVLDDPWGDHAHAVKFDRIPESVEALRGLRFDGIAAVGDRPAVLAAASTTLPFSADFTVAILGSSRHGSP